MRGFDLGNNWEEVRKIDMARGRNSKRLTSPISQPEITSSDAGLLATFMEGLLYFMISNDGGDSWSSPKMIDEAPARNIVTQNLKNEGVFVFWIDDRRQKIEWWSKVPILDALAFDADVSWVNNDLYYAYIVENDIIETKCITPLLSYAGPRKNMMATAQLDNNVVIFWSGKRKVGKTMSESKFPYEIFFKILE